MPAARFAIISTVQSFASVNASLSAYSIVLSTPVMLPSDSPHLLGAAALSPAGASGPAAFAISTVMFAGATSAYVSLPVTLYHTVYVPASVPLGRSVL